MSGKPAKVTDAYRCSCPGCGDTLTYDIRSRAMFCGSCHGSWTVDQLKDEGSHKEQAVLDTVEYTCPSCGASVHSSQTTATSFCSFCGAEVVLTERLSHMRRPDSIVPFRITREECESIYRKKLKDAPFAPKDLLAQKTIDHFRPVYVPYWSYAFHSEGEVDASGVRHYANSSYNFTDSYRYRLLCNINISDLIYDASSAFEDETAQKLNFQPRGNTDSGLSAENPAVPFHPAYLCGMYAEAPDTEPVIFKDHLEPVARQSLNDAIKKKTGSNAASLLPEERTTDAQLLMLPVWLLANRQGGRILYTAINGDSGQIVCDTPVSNKRFAFLSAGFFAVFTVLLLFFTHFIILRPNLLLGFCGLLAVLAFHRIVPAADRILIRRQRDTDPTRAMKNSKSPEGKDSSITNSEEMREMMKSAIPAGNSNSPNGRSYVKIFLHAFAGLSLFLIFLGTVVASDGGSGSQALRILISDRGLLVPILLMVSMVFLFTIKYKYPSQPVDAGKKKSGCLDVLLLYALRAILGVGACVSVLSVPGISIWNYSLSILILLLIIANMIRVFHLHNEYVTRPVPFFGKEAQE